MTANADGAPAAPASSDQAPSQPGGSHQAPTDQTPTDQRYSFGGIGRALIGGPLIAGPTWATFPPVGRRVVWVWIAWCAALVGGTAGAWGQILGFAHATGPARPIDAMVAAILLTGAWLFVGRSPLMSWRIMTIGLAWLVFTSAPSPWPWPITSLIAYGVLLVFIAVRYPPSFLAGIWLWSAIALWIGGRGASWQLHALLDIVMIGLLALGASQRGRQVVRAELARTGAERDAQSAERAVLAERARIARELHDVVAHTMSMIAIQAEAAPLRTADLPPEVVRTFHIIREAAVEALTETRGIVSLLRGEESAPEREPAPDIERISELVDRARVAGGEVSLTISGDVRPVSAAVGLAAYRIVQEALSNAARHARGAPVDINLTYGADLEVTIRNPAPPPTTFGSAPPYPLAPVSRRSQSVPVSINPPDVAAPYQADPAADADDGTSIKGVAA